MRIHRCVFSTLAIVLGASALGCGSTRRVSLGGGTTSAAPTTGAWTGASGSTPPVASTIGPGRTAPGPTASKPAPPTPTSPTTRRPTPTTAAPVTLTAADSGATVAVRVGAAVELTLAGTSTQWAGLAVSPDGLLAPGPTSAQPPHGVFARWTAVAPGTVRLTATGTAWCPPNPQPVACPLWARLFDVTLVVS